MSHLLSLTQLVLKFMDSLMSLLRPFSFFLSYCYSWGLHHCLVLTIFSLSSFLLPLTLSLKHQSESSSHLKKKKKTSNGFSLPEGSYLEFLAQHRSTLSSSILSDLPSHYFALALLLHLATKFSVIPYALPQQTKTWSKSILFFNSPSTCMSEKEADRVLSCFNTPSPTFSYSGSWAPKHLLGTSWRIRLTHEFEHMASRLAGHLTLPLCHSGWA